MAEYLTRSEQPAEALLKLKLRELITSILLGRKNQALAAYFRDLASRDKPSIAAIMEANFCHNLPLEVFARMCHRSLAAFKREFQSEFGISPGRWLLERGARAFQPRLPGKISAVTQPVSRRGGGGSRG